MNWGKAIIIVFVLFVSFMMFFLVKTLMMNTQSVPAKYYEKGLKYQEVIDAKVGASEFGPLVVFAPSPEGNVMYVHFSKSVDSGSLFLTDIKSALNGIKVPFGKTDSGSFDILWKNNPVGPFSAVLEFYHNGHKFRHEQKHLRLNPDIVE
jgi:hypothetical protein